MIPAQKRLGRPREVNLPPAWYVVLEPPVQVPTAAIFSAPELRRNTACFKSTDWHPGFGGNDLEPIARARFPAVGEAIDCLSTFGRAQMSGSGACVFAEFGQREEAESVLSRLPSGMRRWLATGLARHPLFDLAV